MTTFSASYPSSANALTCTLASLASSTTAGRSSTTMDNTTSKYEDYGFDVKLKTNGSAPTGEKGSYIYLAVSQDGTNLSGSSAEAVGTDVAVTFDTNTNLFGPYFLSMPAASTTYRWQSGSIAALIGFVPQKACVIVNNQTGNALDSTAGNHSVTWSAFQRTSV